MSFPNWFWHVVKKYIFLLHTRKVSFIYSMNHDNFSNIFGYVDFERNSGLVHYELQDLNIFLSSLYLCVCLDFEMCLNVELRQSVK